MSVGEQICLQCGKSVPGPTLNCPGCGEPLLAPTLVPEQSGWFYAHEGRKQGPVSFEELRALAAQGQIRPDHMLRSADAQRWQPAADLPGLFDLEETGDFGGASAGTANIPSEQSSPTLTDPGQTVPELIAPAAGTHVPAAVAGFEILGVLGRGGMGVVYKARHESLQRLVALKMILAGEHASPDLLERFLIEARAVAQLQHPGIVQIFEIGAQNELPWFALEYVEGGSLAQKLGSQPVDFTGSARLLEMLARAMHYAHQRGIIHRDLKPANVLLATDSDGTVQPKITDFGLAKQIDADSAQTRTGAVLGTPSYMAPEQASGRTRDVGPHTDVYALGAILYEMLTGRPPFRGESAMDTIIKVTSEDPLPPSLLQPNVPRDLETMCLKALAKEPAQRYSSALALAQDAERFLAGEPILARRASPLRKLWRQVRRHPLRVAAAVGSVALVVSALIAWNSFRLHEQSQSQRHAADLMIEFEGRLDGDDSSLAHLEELESLLAELSRLDPARAAEARKLLHQRFAASVRAEFAFHNHPVLDKKQNARIEEALTALAERDAELAAQVRREFAQRQAAFERVALLQAPFRPPESKTAADLFGAAPLRQADDALMLKTAKDEPVWLRTRVPCNNHAEIRARFAPGWEQSGRLELWLNAANRGKGYAFALRAAPSFAEARRKKTPIKLIIKRNGAVLREEIVDVKNLPAGELTLSARRQADQLQVQINIEPPLMFRDAFPLRGDAAGVFALTMPAQAALTKLELWRQAGLASAASPLERGDDAYDRGDFNAALAEYQTQANSSRTPAGRAESRYKQALCLIAQRREQEAMPILQQLASDNTSERWHLLGSCQLWRIHLEQHRSDEAEALFARLSASHRFEQLAVVLPEQLLRSILLAYQDEARTWGAFQLKLFNRNRIRDLSRALAIQEYFPAHAWNKRGTYISLARAYFLDDQFQQAARMLEQFHRLERDRSKANEQQYFQACEEYSWLLRLQGQPGKALKFIDGKLFHMGKLRRGYEPLLVERARVLVALGKWREAEADLELFFKSVKPGDVLYRFYAGACLIQGFLLERRGEDEAAVAAWKKGMPGSHPTHNWLHFSSAQTFIHSLLVAGLCGDFNGKHVQEIWDKASSRLVGRDTLGGRLGVLLSGVLPKNPPFDKGAEIFCAACAGGEGRALARSVAFQDRSLRQFVHDVFILGSMNFGQLVLDPTKLNADEEKLLRAMLERVFVKYAAEEYSQSQLLQIFLAFGLLGRGNAASWKAAANILEPDVRGPSAYFAGVYFVSLNKPKEAADFFRAARADAGDNKLLARLADAGLDKVKR